MCACCFGRICHCVRWCDGGSWVRRARRYLYRNALSWYYGVSGVKVLLAPFLLFCLLYIILGDKLWTTFEFKCYYNNIVYLNWVDVICTLILFLVRRGCTKFSMIFVLLGQKSLWT